MTARFLMIALDGADAAMLDRLSADRTLPNLARLRVAGAVRPLATPPGITDDGLWASFQYACGLGDHGRYHYLQRLHPGHFRMAFESETGRPRFWDAMSDAGLRVAILDMPKCAPPRPFNGIHLADWLVHGAYFDAPLSHPPSLAAEVAARFGPRPETCCDPCPDAADGAQERLKAELATSVERKLAAGLHYLTAEPWDLFVIAFKEAHCAGHTFWNPADDGPLKAILRSLDAAVGELAAAAGPDAHVAVFSTTQMAPNAAIEHLAPEIVARINRRLERGWTTPGVRALLRRLLRRPPSAPCELLPYAEHVLALRVQAPGARGRAIAAVADMLAELVDADTGRPVAAAMDRPSAEHAGARAAALPDLLLRLPAGVMPQVVTSPRLGRIEGRPPRLRAGNHGAGGGVLFLTGPAAASAGDVAAVQDLPAFAGRVLGRTLVPPPAPA